MTPEQLDMHKRLQPLYGRVMGEWQLGDWGYLGETLICATGNLEEKFNHNLDGLPLNELGKASILIIPLTIDSEHPERGLWGMLDDVVSLKKHSHTITGVIEYWLSTKITQFYADDPTTAILKALCEQEGV